MYVLKTMHPYIYVFPSNPPSYYSNLKLDHPFYTPTTL